jgi:acyl carrier protein
MDELLCFLKSTLKLDFPIQAATPLLSSGLIPSLEFTSLLIALGKQYGIAIDSSEVGADNFDTVQQIHQFIHSQRGS